ncbi:MAG: LysM peptidoglycan-binding domain-containing protein [Armatimonadota bacterium]
MEIAATISDPADIRVYDCLLPDFVKISSLADRLAELMRLPQRDNNNRDIVYGLISKDIGLLDSNSTLAELSLPAPLTLRLVPEIAAAADVPKKPQRPADLENLQSAEQPADLEDSECQEWDIIIGEPMALVHDSQLQAKLDVHIDAHVHKQIAQFALDNRGRECAGLLLGVVETTGNARIVHITAAVNADEAEGDSGSVRISLAAWAEMLRVRDAEFPELRILGWFHSHSSWGFFMSDADVFIHRHFFPHPNMVAYVLDPATGRDGFFYWHDGRINICPSFGVVGSAEELKPFGLRQKASKALTAQVKINPYKWAAAGVGILLVYFIFTGLLFGKRPAPPPVSPTPVATQVVSDKTNKPEVKPAPKPAAAAKDTVYTIQKRDNPWSICNRVYRDGDLGPALLRYNGLSSAVGLQVGQQIKLPPKETLKKYRNQ